MSKYTKNTIISYLAAFIGGIVNGCVCVHYGVPYWLMMSLCGLVGIGAVVLARWYLED